MTFSCIRPYYMSELSWVLVGRSLYLTHNGGKGVPISINGTRGVAKKLDVRQHERDFLAENKKYIERKFSKKKILARKKSGLLSLIEDAYNRQMSIEIDGSDRLFSSLAEKHVGSDMFSSYFSEPSSLLQALVSALGKGEAYAASKKKVYLLGRGNKVSINGQTFGVEKSVDLEKVIDVHESIVGRRLNKHWKGVAGLYTNKEKALKSDDFFIKKSGNRLGLVVSLAPFCMQTTSGIYRFDTCQTGYSLLIEHGAVTLLAYPNIISPNNYTHPFVYSNNDICFKSSTRFQKKNIFPQQALSIPDSKEGLKELAEKIAFCASTAVMNLHRGYSYEVGPVVRIETFASRKRNEMDVVKEGVKIYENRH